MLKMIEIGHHFKIITK